MIDLPKQFVNTIKAVHKEKGEKWLAEFDGLISECENRWQMEIMPSFDLSYNFVAPAKRRDGKDLVIKLAVPSEEFHIEVEALTLFNGCGIVKVIDVDSEKGVLILERLIPGTTLALLENDEEATYIASQLMKKLWMPTPISSRIPTTAGRERELLRIIQDNPNGIGPIPIEILQEALETYTEMNRTMDQPFLLHGDLHHYNILKSTSQSWLAIDPKGLIGEREFDVIQFLLNKLPAENIAAVIDKRINIFVEELGLDRKRILSWGFAHSVLATCWTIEEGNKYNETFFKMIYTFKYLTKNVR